MTVITHRPKYETLDLKKIIVSIITRYVKSYKKEYDRMMKSVKRMLNTKYFGLEHPVQLSENEVQEFYEKNR